jgi:hypothetical protein
MRKQSTNSKPKHNNKPKPLKYCSHNEILPAIATAGTLFLGDVHSIDSQRLMATRNIQTIICCIKDFPMKGFKTKYPHIKVVCFPLQDK